MPCVAPISRSRSGNAAALSGVFHADSPVQRMTRYSFHGLGSAARAANTPATMPASITVSVFMSPAPTALQSHGPTAIPPYGPAVPPPCATSPPGMSSRGLRASSSDNGAKAARIAR